jgi:rRNA biogenesis protein RRP5
MVSDPFVQLEPGSTMQNCIIRRIDPSVGIFLSTSNHSQFLFVHASRVADERIEKLERAFRIAQEVSCRILGHSLIDGFALATMKPSALNEEIVHFGDLKLGSIVKGRVSSVEKTGIRIALSSTSAISGFIPVVHCSDAGTQSFLKKAKVGKKMRCRIIKLEASHRRVLLTAKPSLLDSDVVMFSSYDQCAFV